MITVARASLPFHELSTLPHSQSYSSLYHARTNSLPSGLPLFCHVPESCLPLARATLFLCTPHSSSPTCTTTRMCHLRITCLRTTLLSQLPSISLHMCTPCFTLHCLDYPLLLPRVTAHILPPFSHTPKLLSTSLQLAPTTLPSKPRLTAPSTLLIIFASYSSKRTSQASLPRSCLPLCRVHVTYQPPTQTQPSSIPASASHFHNCLLSYG